MSSIFETYSTVYDRLKDISTQYANAEGQLSASKEQDSAARLLRIEKLEIQLKKIDEYSEKVEYFRQLAEKHLVSKNLLTITPRELNFNRLRNWAMMIDPTESDDPYAQRIYVQAKCNEMFLRIKREEFERTLEELKKFDESEDAQLIVAVEKLKIVLKERCLEVIESKEFADFVDKLKAAHAKHTDYETIQNVRKDIPTEVVQLGLGGYAQPLPVLEELKYIVKAKIGEFYDAPSSSIMLPVEIPADKENILSVACTAGKEKKLYRGIQNYLLNYISSAPIGTNKVYLLDALHFNNSVLGELKALEGTSSIETVPKDSEAIVDTLKQIVSSLADIDETIGMYDSVEEYNTSVKIEERIERKMLVLVGYPSAFSGEAKEYLKRIFYNFEHYAISMILIDTQYSGRSDDGKTKDLPVEIAQGIVRVRMFPQKEMVSRNNGSYQQFRWYELKQELKSSYVQEIQNSSEKSGALGTEYIRRVDLEEKPPYERGKKSIVLPYGVDQKDQVHNISFDNENFASYLMGASGSGKSTLLHTLITGIIRNYHPDDVELWLADFKMSEFAQYINPLPPHVKYILLDESPELVYDLIDKLTEKMMERQRFFMKHRDMKKVENVPKNIYMPVIFVILDEFSIMSQAVADSQTYRLRLQNLLAKGRALGIKFLFSSQTFTTGIAGLTKTAKAQIQSRIAMKNSKEEITATLELSAANKTDLVKNWIDALPPHFALFKYREGDSIQVKRLQVMYFKGKGEEAYEPQRRLINKINQTMNKVAADKYNSDDINSYVDKTPVIVDGNSFEAFSSANISKIFEQYRNENRLDVAEDDVLAVFGSPRRMSFAKMTTLTSEARENLLLISKASEQACGMSILLSVIRSFELQGKNVQVWAYGRNRLYKAYRDSHWCNYKVAEGIDAVCDEIYTLKQKIRNKEKGNDLIVLVGIEQICADFEFIDGSAKVAAAASGNFAEKQKQREAELMEKGAVVMTQEDEEKRKAALEWAKVKSEIRSKLRAEGKSRAEIDKILEEEKVKYFSGNIEPKKEEVSEIKETSQVVVETSVEERKTEHEMGAYNAKDDFQYIMKQGSRLGYHFMLCINSFSDLAQTTLKLEMFRHRMSFQTSVEESRALFGNKNASGLPEHICQYSDSIERYSFRPYLHRGLTWDGWFVGEDEDIALNSFDI